jgi:hypothetical protein
MLSLSRKRAAKLTAVAVILVSLFGVTTYYAIPDDPRTKTIAFALGPTSMNSINSSVYSLATVVNVTFQNGTIWESVWHLEDPLRARYEINSTDITQIVILPCPAYGGGLDLEEHCLLTLQYAFDWKIYTSLAREEPIDLGLLDVANYTFSHYSANYKPENLTPIPTLNYTLQVNTTGYWDMGMPPPLYGPWTWRIDDARIQNIISNATNPAEVNFDIDILVNLYYQITTDSGTQSGYATVAWAGRWATLQLFHDGNQLLGFRYSCSDIGLRMMAS